MVKVRKTEKHKSQSDGRFINRVRVRPFFVTCFVAASEAVNWLEEAITHTFRYPSPIILGRVA